MVVANNEAYIGTGPIVSTKGTDQLDFTASLSGSTVTVKASSTSGSSTTVNGYRVHMLSGPAGDSTADTILVFTEQTVTGAKTFSSEVILNSISSRDSSVVTINDGLKIGSLSTDNALLYNAGDGTVGESSILAIDESNERLGIGTSSPSVKLDIVGESTNESQVRIAQHNTGSDAPDIRMFKSRGTEASPTAVANSDNLAFVNSFAYDGSSYVQSGAFGWTAEGTDGDSAFRINTRVDNSTATRFQINGSGNGVFTGSVQGKGFTEDINALTSSSTITVNCDLARVHTVTLGTNTEFNITNLPTGGTVTLIITQDGTGSRTATFGTDGSSAVRFPSGSSVLSTGANDIDVVSIFNDGTNFLGNIARNYS